MTVYQTSKLIERAHRDGEKVVFTNGCFDIIHVGHIDLLTECRKHGGCLVVGLNSDHSIRRNKGLKRPINRAKDRAKVLAAMSAVDAVVIFHEDTPTVLVKRLKPDVIVKGAEYEEAVIAGGTAVKRRGGRVVRAPMTDGYSTSALIDKIRSTQ